MAIPEPEDQVQFLFKIQRLLSEGGFVATYKFALLLSLAELAVERGDDTTEHLDLDTLDLAEKFVGHKPSEFRAEPAEDLQPGLYRVWSGRSVSAVGID